MRYLSMFSGIEAASVAWEPLGWTPAAFCEIEAAPSAVLAHHWPHVPNLGDVTKADFDAIGPIDLAVFGSPCQSFSVAGKRLGLDDPRGNLALYALGVVKRLRPRWFLFENVPGLLSSGGGRDFGAFLGTVGDIGYQCAWRTLDAQHFGVPQRRRRVFLVGYLGDWRRAAAVLFERHSLQGHLAPRREKGPPVAALTSTGVGTCGADDNQGQAGHLIPQGCGGDVAPTINAAFGSKLGLDNQHIDSGAGLFVAHSLRGEGFDASEDGTGRGTPLVPVWREPLPSWEEWIERTRDLGGTREEYDRLIEGERVAIPIDMRQASRGATMTNNRAEGSSGGAPGTGIGEAGDPAPTVSTSHPPAVAFNITPSNSNKDYNARESERAQALTAGGNRPSARGGDLITGASHASPQEAYAASLLRALREQIGEEAFAAWGSGVAYSLQSSEILRSEVHGGSVRREADEAGRGLDDGALPREARNPAWPLRGLWQEGCERRSPQGRGLPEQLARELGEALSKLPHEAASTQAFMLGLRRAGEGLGLLQQALPSAQRGPTSAVRRLTPIECEKLQGFPPNFTLVPTGKDADRIAEDHIRWMNEEQAGQLQSPMTTTETDAMRAELGGKWMADGPRYKMLGNSMAVPVVRWIGERIELVESIVRDIQRAA